MVKNKIAKKPLSVLSLTLAFTLVGTTMVPAANAAEVEEPLNDTQAVAVDDSLSEEELLAQIDHELQDLEHLSEEELGEMIEAAQATGEVETRVAPLVIVAALGCAVSGGSALFATDWNSGDQVAWTLAGLLTSCIPGVAQANLVKTIMANRATIGRALKGIGATAAGSTLCGDSANSC